MISYPNRGCIIAPTYQMIRDVDLVELMNFLPRKLIRVFNKMEMRIELENGSTILLRSADEPDRLRGLDLDWFYADELATMSKEAYMVLLGRISQKKGYAWFTTTPKSRTGAWVKTEIYDRWQAGDKDYEVFHFSSTDNPYYPPEEIERMRRSYTREFFAQEIEAQFVNFEGLVYKDFARTRHVISAVNTETLRRFDVGIDFGFTNPTAMLLVGRDADDNAFVVEEFYRTGCTVDDMMPTLQRWKEQHNPDYFHCDPSGATLIEELRRKGIRTTKGNNDVSAGISAISALLRTDKLKILSSCQRLISEFESYCYHEGKGERMDERPIDENNHALDSLRYLLLKKHGISFSPIDFVALDRDNVLGLR